MRGPSCLTVVGLVLAGALAVVPPAGATIDPGAATVPGGRTTTTSDIRLLGLSDVGSGTYGAARNGGSAVASPYNGDTLNDYGAPFHEPADGRLVSDVTGAILRWSEPAAGAWVIHRAGLYGGGQIDYPSPDQPVAFTPDSWLGYAGGTLKKHVFGGATTTLLTGLAALPVVRADADGALVLHPVTVGGQRRTRVGLITFGRAGIETIAEHADADPGGEVPTAIALTPASVVWFGESRPVDVLGAVHRRARAGGSVSSASAPAAARPGVELAATDDTIALTRRLRYRTDVGDSSLRMYVLRGAATTWQQIALPTQNDGTGTPFTADVSGPAASATRIAFAVNGADATTAGVWTIGPGATPTRAARPSSRPGTVTDLSLQAGRLTYGLRPPGALPDRPTPLRRAAVGTGGTLTVGPSAAFAPAAALAHTRTGAAPALSVSGDRAAARLAPGRAALLDDAGTQTGATIPAAEQAIKRSGSYVLLAGRVYRGDDLTPLLDLTGRRCRDTDLFGSLVVCNQPDGRNVLLDAEGRFEGGDWYGGDAQVAIWGTAVAWAENSGDSGALVQVQDLSTPGLQRLYPVQGGVHDLRLGEGAISWLDDDDVLRVLDREPKTAAAPVNTFLSAPAAVDDHLVAGLTSTNPSGEIGVRTLPFGLGSPYRPRLVDALTPVSFAPARAPWKPVFDTTKPLTRAKVTIRQGATVVATLTGSGPAGTVRDVSWNGRTTAGTDAPAGAYTWTFTADARDGDGALVNVNGFSTVTGTVYLTR